MPHFLIWRCPPKIRDPPKKLTENDPLWFIQPLGSERGLGDIGDAPTLGTFVSVAHGGALWVGLVSPFTSRRERNADFMARSEASEFNVCEVQLQ